jgi:hypothetical protein
LSRLIRHKVGRLAPNDRCQILAFQAVASTDEEMEAFEAGLEV